DGADGADGGLEGSGKDKEDATTNDVGDVLAGIDVSEQRRLLKEAQMLSRMRRPGPQPEQKAQNQNKKQKGLSSFFTKKCY
ncbi:MAG: hypothetical protein ABGY24_15580, partial [bacterium]